MYHNVINEIKSHQEDTKYSSISCSRNEIFLYSTLSQAYAFSKQPRTFVVNIRRWYIFIVLINLISFIIFIISIILIII